MKETAKSTGIQDRIVNLSSVAHGCPYKGGTNFTRSITRAGHLLDKGLDKISSLALTDKEILGEGDNTKLEIQIKLDKENKILSIRDRGIGMIKEDLRKNLRTIAKSETL
ncbi:hypothetical protein P3S68_015677 [Capsicum galapagoense]